MLNLFRDVSFLVTEADLDRYSAVWLSAIAKKVKNNTELEQELAARKLKATHVLLLALYFRCCRCCCWRCCCSLGWSAIPERMFDALSFWRKWMPG